MTIPIGFSIDLHSILDFNEGTSSWGTSTTNRFDALAFINVPAGGSGTPPTTLPWNSHFLIGLINEASDYDLTLLIDTTGVSSTVNIESSPEISMQLTDTSNAWSDVFLTPTPPTNSALAYIQNFTVLNAPPHNSLVAECSFTTVSNLNFVEDVSLNFTITFELKIDGVVKYFRIDPFARTKKK